MIKTLPQNIEAEKAVLGSILLRPKAFLEVSNIINSQSFYTSKHAKLFETISRMFRENKPVDILTLGQETDIESSYIAELSSSVPSSTNATYYAELVAKEKKLRDIIELGEKIQEIGLRSDHENITTALVEIEKSLFSQVSQRKEETIFDVFQDYEKRKEEYELKKKLGVNILGIPTGYEKLDDCIDGLRNGHFWVIGGYTSMGKTNASLNIVSNLIKQGKRVVFYSLEMTSVDILSRLIGIMSNEGGKSILKGYIENKENVDKNIELIKNSNLGIHTGMSELSEIILSMYEENSRNPVDLFVIDYIQLMKVKGSSSEYETTTTCATELQSVAKKLDKPLIVLSQISNDGARLNDQVVMSFKGSGAIGASADIAIEITVGEDSKKDWKDKLRNGEKVSMVWNIRKNRHGKVGFINLDFVGHTGVFSELPFGL